MCSEELKSSDAFGAAGGFGAGRRAYVLVNNRAEGNAPLSVQGLVGMLRGGDCRGIVHSPPIPGNLP